MNASVVTIETRDTHPPTPASPEPWVTMHQLAEHLGFGYLVTSRMVKQGLIPGKAFQCGKKTYWRFRLSVVDAALSEGVSR